MKANIYNMAALIRSAVWSKHMPKYSSVFPEKKKKEMTDDEMYRSVLGLNSAFGGNTEVKEVGHGRS